MSSTPEIKTRRPVHLRTTGQYPTANKPAQLKEREVTGQSYRRHTSSSRLWASEPLWTLRRRERPRPSSPERSDMLHSGANTSKFLYHYTKIVWFWYMAWPSGLLSQFLPTCDFLLVRRGIYCMYCALSVLCIVCIALKEFHFHKIFNSFHTQVYYISICVSPLCITISAFPLFAVYITQTPKTICNFSVKISKLSTLNSWNIKTVDVCKNWNSEGQSLLLNTLHSV